MYPDIETDIFFNTYHTCRRLPEISGSVFISMLHDGDVSFFCRSQDSSLSEKARVRYDSLMKASLQPRLSFTGLPQESLETKPDRHTQLSPSKQGARWIISISIKSDINIIDALRVSNKSRFIFDRLTIQIHRCSSTPACSDLTIRLQSAVTSVLLSSTLCWTTHFDFLFILKTFSLQ